MDTCLEVNWRKNLLAVWISQFLAMAGFCCCMPFIPLLLRDNLHIMNDQTRGVCVSVYYLAGMVSFTVACAVWGVLSDRLGRKLMLLRASYAAALFYPLLAFAPDFRVLVLIRFICSFFSGTVNPAQTLLITNTPPEKHGFVLGTLSTAIWSGNMTGYMSGGLIVHYFGYTAAFAFCGGLYLISGLLVHIFAEERFTRPEKPRTKPARTPLRQLLLPGTLRLLILFLVLGIARRIEEPFVAMQVELVHGSGDAAFYTGIVSAAAALGGMISGIMIGRLCDRMSPQKLAAPVVLFSAAATVMQACSVNIGMFIAARFLAYPAAGGMQPILQVMLTRLVPRSARGGYLGWSASFNTAGGVFCSFLSGAVAYFAGIREIFLAAALLWMAMLPILRPVLKSGKTAEKSPGAFGNPA